MIRSLLLALLLSSSFRRRCRRRLSLSHTPQPLSPSSALPTLQGILLKLSRSGDDGDKAFLLLEPGSRFHLTSEPPERPDAPSGFALKLRKHLRSRRLEGLRQLGADRLVDLSFGSGKEAGREASTLSLSLSLSVSLTESCLQKPQT